MDRAAIKTLATEARRALLSQVEVKAAQYGITPEGIQEPQTVTGGLMVAGVTLDTQESQQYQQLRRRLRELQAQEKTLKGAVTALIEEVAYTWFNRLAALRFMEVNGYLSRRVLSSSDPKLVDPDLLRDASDIAELEDLPGLNRSILQEWRDLAQKAPNPEEFLYRRLLSLQCSALGKGLPFLFNESYTALFMPGNLLNQDSIMRKLVQDIAEEDWRDTPDSENGVEIVGWLYQFYISERKDAVIGAKGKVAARDIPAATQLFTPHWIVRYMVENSLGRLWLEGHPESQLREKMPFYLEGSSDQDATSLVGEGAKLPLQPQELTVMDPACGSGHILVYAFDLLFEIYREQGYLERDIPALILEHNLHGLDIDERAVQLASFAVLMKARAKNPRILRKTPKLNILTVQSTRHLTVEQFQVTEKITEVNSATQRSYPLLDKLLSTFEEADHLGSLITPSGLDIAKLYTQLDEIELSKPLFKSETENLRKIARQVDLLNQKYWVVIANPPYMGSKGMNSTLKEFAKNDYPKSKSDLFSIFVERIINLTLKGGLVGLMTPFTWMFLSSYEKLRKHILEECTLTSLIRPEYHAFFESAYVPICSFTLSTHAAPEYKGTFIDLKDFYGAELQPQKTLEAIANPDCGYLYYAKATDFTKIPGSAIAYWISNKAKKAFIENPPIGSFWSIKAGMSTGENPRFQREWYEVKTTKIGFKEKNYDTFYWYPCSSGGKYRKWFGNLGTIVNWKNSGEQIKKHKSSAIRNSSFYLQKGITFSKITSGDFSARFVPEGFLFDDTGRTGFSDPRNTHILLSFLCSKPANTFLSILNPTLSFTTKEVSSLPFNVSALQLHNRQLTRTTLQAIDISHQDWDNFETSWGFQNHPLLRYSSLWLAPAFTQWQDQTESAFQELRQLEEENNRYWIEAYSLQDELTPEVPDNQITIRRADLNRDIRSFISYAVGCMMGRYSLDESGLIHAGQPFDSSRHKAFPADADAILPITDQAYFDDDIVTRFVEFLKVAYDPDTLTKNLDFIANALKLKSGETALQRIRRYFVNEFISDHIKEDNYNKRPIYWLFTSGKKRAFGALIYLHRYTPDTLGDLRRAYVLELQNKLDKEIEQAQQQIETATSTAAKKSISKRLKTLQDQQLELREYQAKLQTIADQRIDLDLDDGVAYNYTRFKGLVYEGTDLKMADLEKKSKWKIELLQQAQRQQQEAP